MSNSNVLTTPVSAASFLSGIGVDTHIAYTDGEYSNIPQVISDLQYLGITQVRDGISDGVNGSAPLSSYIALAEAGIHFTFLVEASTTADMMSTLSLIDQVAKAVPGSVIAIEGPNEINNQPVTFNGVGGLQGALNLQSALDAAVHADPNLAGAAVDYFTGYDAGGVATGPDPSTTAGLANYDNAHPYPNWGEAPAFWVSRANALPNETSTTAPAVYTETGYSTLTVDPTVQAKYTLDLLFDTASQSIAKTYLYDLMDAYAPGSRQGDDGFGLFDYTTAPKPVATAIHNLSTILQDSGAGAADFTPTPLDYTLTGLPSTGNSMVVEKSDGTYVLVIWAEPQIWNNATQTEVAAPTENVTVTLPKGYGQVQVFDPLSGTTAIASYSNTNTLQVAVTDHPILIELSSPSGVAAPTVSISSQTLAHDTGSSATDDITNNGLVTLTGVVTGAAGTVVQIDDGAQQIGTATLNGQGGWSFTTDLGVGTHSLSATAVDPSGLKGFAAAEPTINVDTAAPDLTINAPSQSALSTDVTLSGTVADALASTVNVYNGSTLLGAATVSDGTWTFSDNLAAGTYSFSAVATDVAGNTASASTAPVSVTYPISTTTPVINAVTTTTAYETNGDVLNFDTIDLGSTAPGTLVPVSPAGTLGATPLVTFNWNPSTQLANFLAAEAQVAAGDLGASANIVALGDSTTAGFGSGTAFINMSYPVELARALSQDGISAQSDNFQGGYTGWDSRVSLVGGAVYSGAMVAGGNAIATQAAGQGVDFKLNAAGDYNQVSVSYIDMGDGSVTVSVDGGAPIATIKMGNTGQMMTQTIDIPVGMHGEISIRSVNANPTFIEGAAFSNSLTPQVQVFNAGIPGVESNIVTYGSATGNGDIQGAAALNPKLALINFGINDINDGTETVAQTVQHISQMVTEMRAAGSDVIVIIPQPFDSPNYAADLPALRAALEAYATAANVPIIDLSATYGDSAAALNAAGLLTDNLHPDATLYADIGSGIASLLAQAVTGHATTPPATNPPTVSVTSQVLTHDTGSSATDNITSDGQVTLTGTVTGGAGTTVQIDDGSTNLGSATVNSSGAWSFTTTLAAGTHTLTAVAADPTTGLTATSAAEPVITVETAAPTVTITAPVEVATSAAVTLSGTVSGAAGTTVEVYNGSTDLGAATVSSTGAWSYTTATLSAGSYVFKAVATDLAGNTSSASDPTFTVAANPPTVSVTSQALTHDTGVSATDNITSDGQVTLTGTVTGGAGTTVRIDDGSTNLGAATVNSSGVWSFTTTLAAGTHTLTALATDPTTGLTATSAAEPVITVETAAPTVTLGAPVETATSDTVTLSGTVSGAAGTTVEVYNGSTALGAATVNSSGAWSYTTGTLPTGSYAFKAVATDLAGNTGSATDPTFTVAANPPTVSVTSQVLAQDTGASATDHITSDGQVTLTGTVTGGAGTTVRIDDGSINLGAATVNSSGVWSFTTTLAAGTHTLTALATDPTTGLSATSAAEPVITVETTPPVVTIAAPVEAANATTVALSGTVSGASGTTVEVYNGSTALGAATVTNGTWSYTTAALPAGTYAFKAVATDLAGNTGSAADPSFSVVAHSSGTPSGGSDTLVLNLSGTPVSGQDAEFTVSVDGHQVTGVETLTALRSAGQGQNVTVTGDFGAGSHTVTLNFVNGFAGNPSDADRAIYVNAITLDNQTTFENVGDLYRGPVNFNTQISATPKASNVGSQDTLVLNLSETPVSGADAQFMVSVDGQIVGGVQTVTALHSANQSQNITLNGDFGPGAHTVTIDFLNGFAGNPADANRTLYVNAITLDGKTTTENSALMFIGAQTYNVQAGTVTTPAGPTPPAVSVTSQALTHDTGASATDNITSDGQVTLTGTVTGGAGTTVRIDDGSTNLGAATVNSSGAWSFTTTLAAGTHTLTALATDPSTGLSATSAAEPVITVETAPPVVTIGAPVETATSDTVTLSGTVSGAAGTTVEVYNGSTALGAATVTNGAWTYTATLSAGTYAFKAVATDLAGNTGATDDPTFTVAANPPTVSVTSQVLAQDTGASATDHITSDGQVTLTGTVTGGAGTTVQIDDGSAKLGAATVNSSGVWSFTTTLAAGTHTLTALATDPTTGLSATSAAEPVITVETTPPVVAIAAPVEAASATTVALSGTVSGASGTTVEVYNGSTALGAATVTNGTWSYTTAALPAGTYAFKAVATDLAGNTGSAADPSFSVVAHSSGTPSGGSDTLVLNLSGTPVSGQDAEFTVSVDGHQVTGVETLTALRSAGQGQNVTVTGDFGAGSHTVTLNFVNGFAGNPSDADRAIYVNAITLDNQTTFENVGDLYRGPVNFNTQISATPKASNVGSQDTLVLNLSETPVSGADAQFMVSVDGQIVGGVQTVTALHSANQSQNITLNGDFGPGAHTVTIDFLNGFAGNPADANRTLYVNAITLDGKTTTENSGLMFIGAQTYNVQAGGVVSETAATISASLDSLNANTQVGQVDVSDSLAVTPTVRQLTADQRVLGLLHNLDGAALGLDVTDTAANISSALNALSADSAVAKITVSDSQAITLSASQLTSDAHAIGQLTFANGSAPIWTLVDTSAHINGLTVTGLASGDEIDLTDLAAAGASATFTENAAATAGTLSITSGQHVVSLTLLGQFAAANSSGSALTTGFHLTGDGSGLLISYHG